jgi:hypothetical protein
MIPNDESSISRFLQKHGAIFTPGNQFFHWAIADFLSGLGFIVLSVEKFDTHPVWEIRLRMTPNAQLHVLVELPAKGSRQKQMDDPMAEQLRQLMSRFLREFGPPVPGREIAVVRNSSSYLGICFVWPRGGSELWQPVPRKKADPWQAVRRWLGDWAN